MVDELCHELADAEYAWQIRLNQICDQFEDAWRDGDFSKRPMIEDELRDCSETQHSRLLVELLSLELDYRCRRGEAPLPDEYVARFPEHPAVIAEAFLCWKSSDAATSRTAERQGKVRHYRQLKPSHISIPQAKTRIGDFELLEEIGRGGMGIVYKAWQISLDRIVAVKMILAGELAENDEVERFRSEAKATASLKHPHIVPIYEVGEEAGRHFFAMEFIEGKSLAEMLAAGPLRPRDAARLIAIVAEAIHYAHDKGIIHRDLKPGNVLLDRAGEPHITDFGLACRYEIESHLTPSGQVLGTPSFIPPEQAINDSAAIGPATDVYSLGALLYTLLTGRPPFQASSFFETLLQVIGREPISPRLLNPEIPTDLEVICLKCLEKNPIKRCASAAELGEQLGRFLRHEPIIYRRIGPIRRAWRWCRRKPTSGSLIAVIAAGLVVAVTALYVHDRDLSELNTQFLEKTTEAEAAKDVAQQQSGRTGDMLYAANMRLAATALNEFDPRVLADLLDRHVPTAHEPADRRGFEWYYLKRQASKAHRTLLALGTPQYIARYSPDYRLIAVAGADAVVRLLDTHTEKSVREIITGQVEVNGIAFAPDGKELATAGDDGSVRIWNLATGTERLTIERACPEKAFQVVFVPSFGLLACCGDDSVIRLFDSETSELRGVLVDHKRTVQSLGLGQDGQTLFSASDDGTAMMWNLKTQLRMRTFEGTDRIGVVAFDTRYNLVVTGSEDGRLSCWRVHDGVGFSHRNLPDGIGSMALHPSADLLATGDRGGGIRIWNLDSNRNFQGNEEMFWHAHRGNVYSLAWSADGTQLLSAGHDGRVVVWNLPKSERFTRIELGSIHVNDIAPIADGSLMALARDDGLEVMDWRTAKAVSKFEGGKSACVEVAANDAVLAECQNDGGLSFWNTHTWKELATQHLGGRASGFAIAPDGSAAAVSRYNHGTEQEGGERSVCLYDAATAELADEINLPTCNVLAYAPDGKCLAIAEDAGFLTLWSFTQQKPLWRVAQTVIHTMAFSPDGKYVVTSGAKRDAVLRDAESGQIKHVFAGHRSPVATATFSPDSRTLATGSRDGVIKLWHVATGQELFALPRARGECQKLRFTNDGMQLIALINNNHLLVFHAEGE